MGNWSTGRIQYEPSNRQRLMDAVRAVLFGVEDLREVMIEVDDAEMWEGEWFGQLWDIYCEYDYGHVDEAGLRARLADLLKEADAT